MALVHVEAWAALAEIHGVSQEDAEQWALDVRRVLREYDTLTSSALAPVVMQWFADGNTEHPFGAVDKTMNVVRWSNQRRAIVGSTGSSGLTEDSSGEG